MNADAIVFQQPCQLSVRSLPLRAMVDGDVEVEVSHSGISTGTERLLWDGSMPPFPGMGYPLVPGYETVGRVVSTQGACGQGQGASASATGCLCPAPTASKACTTCLAAPARGWSCRTTGRCAWRAIWVQTPCCSPWPPPPTTRWPCGGARDPAAPPDLIVGHGVMGRLLARLTVAAGAPAPVVWETQPRRQTGAEGYTVIAPDDDDRKDYRAIYDVSGDAAILDRVIPRLAKGGEVVLAGFYKQDLSFAFAPAFMREAQIRIAAEWKRADLLAVTQLVQSGRLSLDGLITHLRPQPTPAQAYETAFADPDCLKMVLDWRH